MNKLVKVTYKGNLTKEFLAGTTLKEISEHFKMYYNFPILLAKVDNHLCELSETIDKKCEIDFYDRTSGIGNNIYGKSLQFILVLAVKRVLGNNADVIIQHSIDKGFYCEIINEELDKPILKKIDNEMKSIIAQDLNFMKMSVDRIDAIKFFKKQKQLDKAATLKYISNSYINLYRIDSLYDYFYGQLAHSTSQITDYKLAYIKDNGFAVNYPDIYNPDIALDYKHHRMLFNKFLDYTIWGETLGIKNASDLNEIVSKGKYDELIHLSETYYNQQLSRIADQIYERKSNVKLILLAGPSSSGKTTSSKKLQIYLKSQGIKTHQISLDDYYKNRIDTPRDEMGEMDYETIDAIDTSLFNKHMVKLLAGEKVLLPEYDFVLGERVYKNKYLQLGNNDIVIIEGLHALNEKLTSSIERKNKFKIYISPLTQLNLDNHNRVHTTDTRKLRRIIRDSKYRGAPVEETLSMWKKIRLGEEKYIFPYQDEADSMINSSLMYELGILKTYAEPLLFSIDENSEHYPEALRLINFLRNFLPIPSDDVPADSILREFIGGSAFK